jgi:hydroxymethylglutaryl-CoA lyase
MFRNVKQFAKSSINILEVGLRDGLQNEKKILSVNEKKYMLDLITQTGINQIEIGSFVSPKWIPQLGDTDKLIESIPSHKRDKLYLSTLVPNLKGLEAAINCKVNEIVLFVSVSETFNKKNINSRSSEAFARFAQIATLAKQHDIKLRGSISCCFECPYEGRVYPLRVIEFIQKFIDLGIQRIDIADTIGTATPQQVCALFNQALIKYNPDMFSCHFHDSDGNSAILNIEQSYLMGIRHFQSSIAGIGGCPYSSKKSGNLDTVKLIRWAESKGIHTGIDLSILENNIIHVNKLLHSVATVKL